MLPAEGHRRPTCSGYWYPDDNKGLIGNDTIAIPSTAQNPRLAHEFLNFFLDEKWGYENFVNWNGYQPPFTTIEPDTLDRRRRRAREPRPRRRHRGDVHDRPTSRASCRPRPTTLWLDAWNEIQAGG